MRSLFFYFYSELSQEDEEHDDDIGEDEKNLNYSS